MTEINPLIVQIQDYLQKGEKTSGATTPDEETLHADVNTETQNLVRGETSVKDYFEAITGEIADIELEDVGDGKTKVTFTYKGGKYSVISNDPELAAQVGKQDDTDNDGTVKTDNTKQDEELKKWEIEYKAFLRKKALLLTLLCCYINDDEVRDELEKQISQLTFKSSDDDAPKQGESLPKTGRDGNTAKSGGSKLKTAAKVAAGVAIGAAALGGTYLAYKAIKKARDAKASGSTATSTGTGTTAATSRWIPWMTTSFAS